MTEGVGQWLSKREENKQQRNEGTKGRISDLKFQRAEASCTPKRKHRWKGRVRLKFLFPEKSGSHPFVRDDEHSIFFGDFFQVDPVKFYTDVR
jgi:hypothetical protein